MTEQKLLRQQLLQLLEGRNAHMTFEDAVADFPTGLINIRPPQVPYTFWHLVEHLRIAQWDILDFINNAKYVYRAWPEGYWPDISAEAAVEEWKASIVQFRNDRELLANIVRNDHIDIFAELDHAPGYTILREILVVADHNAYHIGELAILRQVMGAWPQAA